MKGPRPGLKRAPGPVQTQARVCPGRRKASHPCPGPDAPRGTKRNLQEGRGGQGWSCRSVASSSLKMTFFGTTLRCHLINTQKVISYGGNCSSPA